MQGCERQLVLCPGVHVNVNTQEEEYTLHVLLLNGYVQEIVALVIILQITIHINQSTENNLLI